MRTYKEQTKIILKKYEQHRNTQKRRKEIIYTILASAACLAIIMASLWPADLLNNNSFTADKRNGIAFGLDESEYSTTDKSTVKSNPVTDIFFNNMEETPFDATRLYFDPNKTYEKKLDDRQTFEYLGKNILPVYMPHGLNYWGDIDPGYRHTIVYNNDGTICYDRLYFSYAEDFDNYEPLARKMNITVSKAGTAQEDCVYIWAKDMKASEIKGTVVLLGERKMPYGPYTVVEGPNIPAGYYDIFIAEFSFGGLEYQIISDNFTKEDFVKVITSMIG